LGGLVAIPVLAITGLFQHLAANKKIKQLKEEETKILKLIGNIKKNLVQFDAIELRSDEIINSINKSLEAYKYEYIKTYKKLFPLGIISKILKTLKNKILRKPYYSDNDLVYIQDLGNTTGFILKMVDSPIF
jgi:hypothetical protein